MFQLAQTLLPRPIAHLATATLGALLVTAGAARAQCVGPDNLDGPCWAPVLPTLPQFGDIVLPGAGVCWNFCDPGVKDSIRVMFSSPTQSVCGQYRSDVKIETSAGAAVLLGTATLDYTRTWNEVDSAGNDYQVWRLLAKIDFREEPGAPAACWNPPCLGPAPAHPTCFWYGYVDYAENCATGTVENALALYHSCDDYSHNQFLSSRPAPAVGFHPGSFYGIVAPDTALNPFDPGIATTPPSGVLSAEALRNVPNFAGAPCIAEEQVGQGFRQLLGQSCLCPIVPSAVQSASRFAGSGTCNDPLGVPSSWQSLSIVNPAISAKWFDLVGTSLGTWTTDSSYPGKEAPFAHEGFIAYHDSCAAIAGLPADTLDVSYGAETIGGYDVIDVVGGVPASQNFLDLASNYSRPFVALPLMGNVEATDHLIYVNVP